MSDAARPWLAIARDELRRPVAPRAVLLIAAAEGPFRRACASGRRTVRTARRAREKFSQAERMFFTRKGLEQATDEQFAAYKASRFSDAGRVADLCCGIGGDLLALAAAAAAVAFDLDPVACLLAEANAAALRIAARALPRFWRGCRSVSSG